MNKPEFKPADIILQQLGGRNRLQAMIGARDIYSDDNGLSLVFKFMQGAKNKANYLKITLADSDTYTVKFVRITRKKDPTFGVYMPVAEDVSEFELIYCDQLIELIEAETGLFLHM